jgi:hypothetical protein
MHIADVYLSPSAVASLATYVERVDEHELAAAISLSAEGSRDEMKLSPLEEGVLLSALYHCPAELQPLRDTLHANVLRRTLAR